MSTLSDELEITRRGKDGGRERGAFAVVKVRDMVESGSGGGSEKCCVCFDGRTNSIC